MKSIGRMVEGAMRQIASESRMNAKRVKNFGVQIEESDSTTHAPEASSRE
jgi:hypothetical protein